MVSNNKASVYENLTFDEMVQFRKDAFRIMDMYNLTKRSIDLSFVEANEELAMQIFVYGSELARYCHDRDIQTDEEDLDLIRRALDALQDEMPQEELSFVANHYEESLSIYHCGFIFMQTMYDRESHTKHVVPQTPAVQQILNAFTQVAEAREKFLHTEDRMFQKMIHIFIKDKVVLDYLDNHQEESLLLVRKGRTWWNSGQHKEVDDLFSEDSEVRNEYFRQVMFDGTMQNNVIINDNKEIGFLLFKLGAIAADMTNKLN